MLREGCHRLLVRCARKSERPKHRRVLSARRTNSAKPGTRRVQRRSKRGRRKPTRPFGCSLLDLRLEVPCKYRAPINTAHLYTTRMYKYGSTLNTRDSNHRAPVIYARLEVPRLYEYRAPFGCSLLGVRPEVACSRASQVRRQASAHADGERRWL